MSSTAQPADGSSSAASKMGLLPATVVQELGWDEDVDDALRSSVEDAVGTEMIEEAMEAVDVVLLWFRDDDGDLVDVLVDALTDLTDVGYIWLLTPKVGRDGYVDATELAEGAVTAGLAQTTSAAVSSDWAATKLVRPKGTRR